MSVSNFCAARVYIDPGCIDSWTDVSGEGAAVAWDGGGVRVGETHVFNEDAPLLASGKADKVTVTTRVHYTEGAGEPVELVRAVYEGGCSRGLCVRWIPLGATGGNKQYTTVSGILITPVWPAGEAASADITMIEFKVDCSTILVDDVP